MIDLVGVPGLVSVWWGPVGGAPAFAHHADEPHYAASLMKLALFQAARGLRGSVIVHNSFRSAAGPTTAGSTGLFGCDERDDSDPAVWARLGSPAPLSWLAERMITHSSNLASNLVLEAVGIAAADAVWRRVGAGHSTIQRGIEDAAARAAGLTNTVTAADLARLLATLDPATPTQVIGTEIVSALPPGTRVIRKGGWVTGVRHAAALVTPDDAAPFILVTCLTTPLPDPLPLIHRLTALAWAGRHDLGLDGAASDTIGPKIV